MNNNFLIYRRIWRQTPGALLSRECVTPHLLKGVMFAILVDRYDVITPLDGKDTRDRRRCLLSRDLTGWE